MYIFQSNFGLRLIVIFFFDILSLNRFSPITNRNSCASKNLKLQYIQVKPFFNAAILEHSKDL